MKRLLYTFYANRYFFLFILLFAYFQSIYTRIIVRGNVDAYIFTPDAAIATLISVSILYLIMLFFIRKMINPDVFGVQEMIKIFSDSLVIFVIATYLIGFVIAFSFNTIERNFNQQTLILSTLSNFLDGIIYGSFFLAYYYFQQNTKKQKQLISYNQAISESKINQLKTQLNPHFLFNNLNVLDQLIDEDKNKASEFLNEFADIYRYVLQASDKKFVTIEDELIFAEHYFKLIAHKYGNAYQLALTNKNNHGYIIPLALQLLLENAVQHNLGTAKNPVSIQIHIDNTIRVTNNYIPKKNAKTTSGRGLNNLREQYKLLTKTPIEIQNHDSTFSVSIPIIHKLEQ
ncbi:sensor histidine kinase [Leeuwenhoekiella sp. MAR_2009_132]|uniref:sensor histidine kinase n=1 Tax=Leeuwenhoekiella sp. MAR_2009_132 TaxID=1392489 RepID=UPI00048AD053|nr:sensor histidine kinase [Leeuwenhoekiella sp. MAR_2009_132]